MIALLLLIETSLNNLGLVVGTWHYLFFFFLHLTIIFDGRLVLAILQLKLLATSLKKRENALCMVRGTPKGHSVPTKTPSPEATRSNPGKAKSYEPNALNETMLL